jgi:hypothetical protein
MAAEERCAGFFGGDRKSPLYKLQAVQQVKWAAMQVEQALSAHAASCEVRQHIYLLSQKGNIG